MPETGRSVSAEVTLRAAIEDAWRALTDARELTRWFPLAAHVDGRVGGRVVWDWGQHFHWPTRVEVWEPPHHLRLAQESDRPHEVDGRPITDAAVPRANIVMDFRLETHKGTTTLRLVHSGFGTGAAWDDELEGVRNGWAFELRGLAHYLARHRGRDRYVGWGTGSTGLSFSTVWRRLLGAGGYTVGAAALAPGEPYALRTPGGETMGGVIQLYIPEREFVGTVRELDHGIFRLGTWPAGRATGISLWHASWSPEHRDRVRALGAEAQEFLHARFPDDPDEPEHEELPS